MPGAEVPPGRLRRRHRRYATAQLVKLVDGEPLPPVADNPTGAPIAGPVGCSPVVAYVVGQVARECLPAAGRRARRAGPVPAAASPGCCPRCCWWAASVPSSGVAGLARGGNGSRYACDHGWGGWGGSGMGGGGWGGGSSGGGWSGGGGMSGGRWRLGELGDGRCPGPRVRHLATPAAGLVPAEAMDLHRIAEAIGGRTPAPPRCASRSNDPAGARCCVGVRRAERAGEAFGAAQSGHRRQQRRLVYLLMLNDHRIEIVADHAPGGAGERCQWRGVCQLMEGGAGRRRAWIRWSPGSGDRRPAGGPLPARDPATATSRWNCRTGR